MIQITSWNRCAPRFLRAPTFEWKASVPARKYRVEISARELERKFTVLTREPRISFAPYWSKLPCCEIHWTITALNGRGETVERSAFLKFCKADGRFVPSAKHADWRACAERNVRFL